MLENAAKVHRPHQEAGWVVAIMQKTHVFLYTGGLA